MKKILLAVLGLALLGAKCTAIPVDRAMASVDANDMTVMIKGCGSQPVVGYTYCRKTEGGSTEETLSLFGPPSIQCTGTGPCVFFTVYFPDGSPSLSVSLPRGKSSVSVKWKDLIKGEAFEKNYAGFWGIVRTFKYLDTHGREHVQKDLGEIRLRVLSQAYEPLHEAQDDNSTAWRWSVEGYNFGMTTGGRGFIQGKQ